MGTWEETNYRPPFEVGQDRTIDHQTVDFYCTGCPFKGVAPINRPTNSNPSGDPAGKGTPGGFDNSSTNRGGFIPKIQYVCESPNFNFKQSLLQEGSTIGFGWCPFREQKDATRLGGNDHNDMV